MSEFGDTTTPPVALGVAAIRVAAVRVGSLTIRGLEGAVERPRPPVATQVTVETSTSLPSGHSLVAVLGLGLAVTTVLALLPATAAVMVPVP